MFYMHKWCLVMTWFSGLMWLFIWCIPYSDFIFNFVTHSYNLNCFLPCYSLYIIIMRGTELYLGGKYSLGHNLLNDTPRFCTWHMLTALRLHFRSQSGAENYNQEESRRDLKFSFHSDLGLEIHRIKVYMHLY